MSSEIQEKAYSTYLYNDKIAGFPPFRYLNDLTNQEIFFCIPIILVCYVLFRKIEVKFSSVIGIIVGLGFFFLLVNNKRTEKNVHTLDIEKKTEKMEATKMEALKRNAALSKFFIKYYHFFDKNKKAFRQALYDSNYFSELLEKSKAESGYLVGYYIKDLQMVSKLILNNFSSIVIGMPDYNGYFHEESFPNALDNELSTATKELQSILYSEIYTCIQKYEAKEEEIKNYPNYVPSSLFYGPTGNDMKTKRYSPHFDLY